MKDMVLVLEGLNCSSCASKIEGLAGEIPGVESVDFNFVSKKMTLKLKEDQAEEVLAELKSIVKRLEPDVRVIEEKKPEFIERTLILEDLNCAGCAAKIEDLTRELKGVESANLDFVSKKLRISLDKEREKLIISDLKSIVKKLEPDVRVIEEKKPEFIERTLILEGLNCAGCAAKIEALTRELKGVESANLDFVSKKLKISLDSSRQEILIEDIKAIVKKLEPDVEVRDHGEVLEKRRNLILKGLDCADCAKKIEDKVRELDGVKNVELDFVSEKLKLTLDASREDKVVSGIKKIVASLEPDVEVIEEGLEPKDSTGKKVNRDLLRIAASLFLFLIPILAKLEGGISLVFYVSSFIVVGYDIIIKAFKNLLAGQALDEYFLMTIATIGAFIVGEYKEGVMVMLLYQLGMYLQGRAVNHSRSSISALMDIRPDYANLEKNKEIIVVDPSLVEVGDIIVIKPGEKVALDGFVVEGKSSLDTSNITGESLPRLVRDGDQVLSGSINNEGLLRVKVEKEFKESTVSKVLDLVENASSRKAKTEDFISKFARYYTPIVVGVAGIIGILVPLIFKQDIRDWAYRAFTFLVISCPCALVISVPLGFFGGIGAASKEGILIKGGNYLEALNDVDTLVFDKTGTITEGVFEVTEIHSFNDYDKEEILELAAYAEYHSSHPIGKSILESYAKEIDQDRIGQYRDLAGKGIDVVLDGRHVLVGNKKLLEDENIAINFIDYMGTVAYVAYDNKHIGTVVVSDRIKTGMADDLSQLKERGIKKTIMLSGDNEETARKVAEKVGIDEARGGLLPQDKVEIFEEILNRNGEGKVAFVGDGVNDAPALARADIGIAMGGLGSDAAIEASDIVIMTDEISKINTAFNISKKTRKIVMENIYLALGVKLLVLILGALGRADMWMAVFADVGVSIIAIFNSIRALKVDK